MEDIDARVNALIRNVIKNDKFQKPGITVMSPKTNLQQQLRLESQKIIQENVGQQGQQNTLKQKIQDLRDQLQFKEELLNKATEELIQLKAERRLLSEQSQGELSQLKQTHAQTMKALQDRFKQLIDQLIAEKQQLAAKNQEFAQQVLDLQTAQKEKIFAQNSKLSEELQQLKMQFSSRVQQERQRMESAYNQKLRVQVSEAVEMSEKQMGQRIEPEIQRIISEHQIKLIQQKTVMETEKMAAVQQIQQKMYEEFEKAKAELLKQKEVETQQKISEALQKHNFEHSSYKYDVQTRVSELEKQHTQIIADLIKKEARKLDDVKYELERKLQTKDLQIAEMDKQLEIIIFQFEQMKQQLHTEFSNQIQDIKQSFRQFALNLHKTHKHDLLMNLESQKQNILMELAQETDTKTKKLSHELDSYKQTTFIQNTKQQQDYEVEITKLKTAAFKAERDSEAVKLMNNNLMKQLQDIQAVCGDNIQQQQTHYECFQNTMMLQKEDYQSQLMRNQLFHLKKEQMVYKVVESKIETIIGQKDSEMQQQASIIQRLEAENYSLKTQLTELEDI